MKYTCWLSVCPLHLTGKDGILTLTRGRAAGPRAVSLTLELGAARHSLVPGYTLVVYLVRVPECLTQALCQWHHARVATASI